MKRAHLDVLQFLNVCSDRETQEAPVSPDELTNFVKFSENIWENVEAILSNLRVDGQWSNQSRQTGPFIYLRMP